MNNPIPKKANKHILVTGSHRSGSTWLGKMLSLSSGVIYIHEPFHPHHRLGVCDAVFPYWYTYVCEHNENKYYQSIDDCLNLKWKFYSDYSYSRSLYSFTRSLSGLIRYFFYNLIKKRVLIKDPFALFSAEWLAKNFNIEVIVLIRHPAAFVGSIKVKNWRYPFNHFLNQPLLMEEHLSEFRNEIEHFSNHNQNVVEQAILLWNIIHSVILKYKTNYSKWIFIKHEELSSDFLTNFSNLYAKLNLDFTPTIASKIQGFSKPSSSPITSTIVRDSKENIYEWKNRLNEREIALIRDKTRTISSNFYEDSDW